MAPLDFLQLLFKPATDFQSATLSCNPPHQLPSFSMTLDPTEEPLIGFKEFHPYDPSNAAQCSSSSRNFLMDHGITKGDKESAVSCFQTNKLNVDEMDIFTVMEEKNPLPYENKQQQNLDEEDTVDDYNVNLIDKEFYVR
ncbi:hypothetical protein L1887_25318 [Cichorium endivia]|nr:hypothetical protein L1887_25318 [Cichorium endivia]